MAEEQKAASPQSILLKDIPNELVEAVIRDLGDYTVAFFDMEITQKANSNKLGLLGSGTLVSLGEKRAILTAHHVIKNLPTTGSVGVFLGPTNAPHSLEVQALTSLGMARGTNNSVGPDIGAIVLAPHIADSIAAKKSFYNLGKRRDRLLGSPPVAESGFWMIQGFVAELSVMKPEWHGMTRFYYNFSALSSPSKSERIDAYDFFDILVSKTGVANAPRNWGGISGGGLWQVELKRNEGVLETCPPLLSGVAFYQAAPTESGYAVRCHGRESIYRTLYDSIVK